MRMRIRNATLAATAILGYLADPGRADEVDDKKAHRSVVKVEASLSFPDPYRPWMKSSPRDAIGSGVVIEGKRILTNAHMVNFAGQVTVRFEKSSEKLPARVLAVAPGIDLAVLALEDESTFDARPPLPLAEVLPDRQQAVLVYGFPEGGSELSITRGIVSRIEYAEYYLGIEGLRVQVDAAVNPGNSGGPVVSDGRMIGLVFSKLDRAGNIGYIIPTEEIRLFLDDIKDGRYDGKPILPIVAQTLENPTLRQGLRLDRKATGVLVRRVFRLDADFPIRVDDVLTRLGDHAIDNTGMTTTEKDLTVRYPYLVQRLIRGGKVAATVIRGGKELALEIPVDSDQRWVVRRYYDGASPYFIFGPLVFSEASNKYAQELLHHVGGDEDEVIEGLVGSGNPLYPRIHDRAAFPGERLVVAPMFGHKIAKGFDDPYSYPVAAVNGTRVRNLPHLVEVLRDAKAEFVEFTFQGQFDAKLVFRRKEAIAATEEVLNDNGIRQQCSPDMARIWDLSKAK